MSSSSLTGVAGGTESSSERAKDGVEPRRDLKASLVGRLVLDETLVPRADVLASLASQKTNNEGGDLKQPERDVVFVTFPYMVQVMASSAPLLKSMV